MAFFCRILPKLLSVAALALWFCSLALPCLVFRSGETWTGGQILLMGWLGVLQANIAWFANFFFWYGIICLLSGKVPIVTAILAVLLSLDTFLLPGLPRWMGEGGPRHHPVIGYGWGTVLWFLSIFLMLVAVGVKQREINCLKQQEYKRDWILPLVLGLVLLMITAGTASYFTSRGRMITVKNVTYFAISDAEAKRGKVCSVPEPVAINPIRNLSGPVEIVEKDNTSYYNPFVYIDELLGWGIPAVRVGNVDYVYESTARNEIRLISAVPAVGKPAAVLFVDFVDTSDSFTAHVRLVESPANHAVFDQTWKRENSLYPRFCPDYSFQPKLNEQPRKFIMQALGLDENQIIETRNAAQEKRNGDFRGVTGIIIERRSGGDTSAIKRAGWKEMRGYPHKKIYNINCPGDADWDDNRPRLHKNGLPPFMWNGKAYYFRDKSEGNITCTNEFVYMYSGYYDSMSRGYRLNIEKRDTQNFRQAWARVVVIRDISLPLLEDVLKVQSIEETPDAITLELVNDDSGEMLVVQVSLHDK
jgi:hypothetical protein